MRRHIQEATLSVGHGGGALQGQPVASLLSGGIFRKHGGLGLHPLFLPDEAYILAPPPQVLG